MTLLVITVILGVVCGGGAYDDVISGGQPPYVASKKHWESRTLDHGQPTTMKCPVQGDGRQPVYFRWFKGEEELFETYTGYKLSGTENKKLTIRKVSTETEGSYRCRGVNGFGSQEFTFIIHLKGKPANTDMEVLVPGILANQTVLKGSPLKLSCRLSTEEMFSIKWLKKVDMNEITELQSQLSFLQIGGENYKVFKVSQSARFLLSEKFILEDATYQHSLSFISAEEDDSGHYMCVVFGKDQESNLSPLANQTAHIEVISPTPLSTLFSAPSSESSSIFPSLTIVLTVLGSVVLILFLILLVLLLKPVRKKRITNMKPPMIPQEIQRNDDLESVRGNQKDLDARDNLIKNVDDECVSKRDPAVSWVWNSQACQPGQKNTSQDTLARKMSDKGNNTFLEFV